MRNDLKKAVSVVLDDAAAVRIQEISDALEDCGLTVDRVIPEASTIYFTVTDEELAILSLVEGVEEINSATSVQLPPMSDDIPQ